MLKFSLFICDIKHLSKNAITIGYYKQTCALIVERRLDIALSDVYNFYLINHILRSFYKLHN